MVADGKELAPTTDGDQQAEVGGDSRFPELDELQREIQRRIRDNQRFLDGFMQDDFVVDEDEESGTGEDDFEEL